MPYTPTSIPRWIEQVNYEGELFNDYYVASWRFFRCSPMERSNHDYIKEHLRDCGAAEGQVITLTFTDEVMAFRYYVLVHKDFERGLRMADMFAKRIIAKGSLDPENEMLVDRKIIHRSWANFGLVAKFAICKEAGISIFAARSKSFPLRYTEALYAVMSEVSDVK